VASCICLRPTCFPSRARAYIEQPKFSPQGRRYAAIGPELLTRGLFDGTESVSTRCQEAQSEKKRAGTRQRPLDDHDWITRARAQRSRRGLMKDITPFLQTVGPGYTHLIPTWEDVHRVTYLMNAVDRAQWWLADAVRVRSVLRTDSHPSTSIPMPRICRLTIAPSPDRSCGRLNLRPPNHRLSPCLKRSPMRSATTTNRAESSWSVAEQLQPASGPCASTRRGSFQQLSSATAYDCAL